MSDDIDRAKELFIQGDFDESRKLFHEMYLEDSSSFDVLINTGHLLLMENKYAEAENWLKKALKVQDGNKKALSLLAEVYYRQDNYKEVSRVYSEMQLDLFAKKYSLLGERTPYSVENDFDSVSVKFVNTDPLPFLKVRVNGSEEYNFVIDTGGAEIGIDAELARKTGVIAFDEITKGTFAGGKKAPVSHGIADSLTVGDLTINNVPVVIMDKSHGPRICEGKPPSGVIGTVFLYHFLSTLDYPRGELVLRKKNGKNSLLFNEMAENNSSTAIPFWMAGKHFMLAKGKINRSRDMLFFVDTGLAGGGFTCGSNIVKELSIPVDYSNKMQGMGAGGPVDITPFNVNELSLGAAVEQNIPALLMEMDHAKIIGFKVEGIISHAFFRSSALSFDFEKMRLILEKKG